MTSTDAGGRAGDAAPRAPAPPWPADAAVVGLVARPADGDVPSAAAAHLADASAGERRTLLANLAGPELGLDAHLGAEVDEGLLAVGRSGRSLRDVARQPEGRGFLYLPAGPPEGPEGEGTSTAGLLGLVRRVAERVRRRDGRLIVFLREDDVWPEGLGAVLDGVVLLGRAALPAWEGGVPAVLGRWPGPRRRGGPRAATGGEAPASGPRAGGGDEDAVPGGDAAEGEPTSAGDGENGAVAADDVPDQASAAAGDGPGPPGPWRRHRRSSGPPWTRIAAGAAAILVLVGGWWWLARRSLPGDGPGPDGGFRTAGADTAPVAAAADTSGARRAVPAGVDAVEGGSSAPDDPTAEGGGVPEALRTAPALPYSVLIASYAQWSQARRRLDAWRDPDGPVYHVAPTRVRGGLYWRLFAGAVEDRAAAEAIMEQLVEQGRKDRVRTWDVRPVELAFLTGVEDSREAARERVRLLEDRGVPGYALPAAEGGDTVWAVYAGAYESSDEAEELRSLLADAEIDAELVTRRGAREAR